MDVLNMTKAERGYNMALKDVTTQVELTASSSPKATGRVVTPNLPRPDSVFKSIASENAGNRGLVRAIFGRSSLSSRIELLAFALSLEGTFELQSISYDNDDLSL